jgi:hypothetical protein
MGTGLQERHWDALDALREYVEATDRLREIPYPSKEYTAAVAVLLDLSRELFAAARRLSG